MKIGKQFRASSKSVIKDDAAAAKPLSSGDKTADKLQVTALSEQIGALQDMLYAGHEHKILVVLQGMDTSGKDGAVSGVFANVNPQGIRIANFKAPTELENSTTIYGGCISKCRVGAKSPCSIAVITKTC